MFALNEIGTNVIANDEYETDRTVFFCDHGVIGLDSLERSKMVMMCLRR